MVNFIGNIFIVMGIFFIGTGIFVILKYKDFYYPINMEQEEKKKAAGSGLQKEEERGSL